MDQQSKDDVDFLEPSVLLDETHYQEGFKNGYRDGLVYGKEEGRQVGLKKGFQVRKNIEQLAALVSSYPLSDPKNEQVQDVMEKIRLKFRVITMSLRAKLEYEGRSTSSKQDVEDL